MLTILLLSVFPLVQIYAGLSDILTMRIPNAVSLILIAAFVVLAPFAGLTFAQMGVHLGVAAGVLVFGFALFALGWIGGGDAKVMAATALWFGMDLTLQYIVIASVFGGLLTLGLVLARTIPLPAGLYRFAFVERLHNKKTGVPYGAALAASAMWLYPQSLWWTAQIV